MGVQSWLQGPGLGAGQGLEALDPVGGGVPVNGFDLFDLRLVGGDQELTATAVGDVMAFDKGVEGAPPLDAELRFQRPVRIIETGMESGMVDLNHSLIELVRAGEISIENAHAYSFNPKGLDRMM